MARIVSTQYRHKRPPKKKRPVAIEVPEVVTVRHRKRASPKPRTGHATALKPTNDDRRPGTPIDKSIRNPTAIVTAKEPKEIREERRRALDAELTKDSPRFQRGKALAIVTNVRRKAAGDDYEAATARWRAYIAKKLCKSDDD